MVWYSHLFQNFPQFIVIHTVKGFGIVNKEEMVCVCITRPLKNKILPFRKTLMDLEGTIVSEINQREKHVLNVIT